MANTDLLQPPLTAAERKIKNAYGSWTNFMICFGFKPYDLDEIARAKRLIAAMAEEDEEEERSRAGGK